MTRFPSWIWTVRNGTFVNSKRVERHELTNGDRVQIGRTKMIYTGGDEAVRSEGLAHIDIVGRGQPDRNSRIVKAMSHEQGSQILQADASESPWLARARSNLQVMYSTALAVSHTLDIDQLLQRIMELIFEWVESDRGCIMIVDHETNELTPTVRHDRTAGSEADEIIISRTILDYVMTNNEGVLTSDAKEDERFDAAGSIVTMGVREAICVPMQGRYGVVGVIYIDTFTPPGKLIQQRANKFSEEHLKLMIAIGHQAALAVEDTAYYSAMVQAERLAAMGQTIATLSHHIKNILQGIRGGSYLIEEGLKSQQWEIAQKGWGIVDRNQEKISNLVMDMLSFSKEREPEMVPSDLNTVALDVVELMRARAEDAGVRLTWSPCDNMVTLAFDPDAMHRAILNVVTNAIDACEQLEAGQVDVSTQYDAEQEAIRVLVKDNGEGISEEDRKRIFSVFASKKGSRGTGLGLPVSQKILQEHNGEIRVESEPGQGSQFILDLPAIRSGGGRDTQA